MDVDATSVSESDASDGGDLTPSKPDVGSIVVSEIMAIPSGSVPQSEWLEIYNVSDEPKLLTGLTLADDQGNAQVIDTPDLIILPSTYALFVRDRAAAAANGIPDGAVAYEYGGGLLDDEGVVLSNASEISIWNGPVQLASVSYGQWNLASIGQSIERASTSWSEQESQIDWCLARSPWSLNSDFGTPGAANDCP